MVILIGRVCFVAFLIFAVCLVVAFIRKKPKRIFGIGLCVSFIIFAISFATYNPSPGTDNNPTITKAEYDKIENGMTYEEVVGIIGGKGEALSEVGEKGTAFYTVVYMFNGEGMLGANANFTFQNGKLMMKAQAGLE